MLSADSMDIKAYTYLGLSVFLMIEKACTTSRFGNWSQAGMERLVLLTFLLTFMRDIGWVFV